MTTRGDLFRRQPTGAQARFKSLSVSRKHLANAAPAVDRSDAARAALTNDEPRKSLNREDIRPLRNHNPPFYVVG